MTESKKNRLLKALGGDHPITRRDFLGSTLLGAEGAVKKLYSQVLRWRCGATAKS